MPTAARLVAALCLAIVGYILSRMVMPLMPEGTAFGNFVPFNMFLGVVVGWLMMGPRAGRGFVASINNGVAGVFVLVLWGVFLQACNEMVRLAMRNRYDGAFEALAAVFQISVDYALIMATVPIGITMVVCALIIGPVVDFAASRWR